MVLNMTLHSLKFIRVVGVLGFVLGVFLFLLWVLFARVFVGSIFRCLTRCLLLGCRLGSLGILRGTSRFYCVLTSALLFLIYITLLVKKKKKP
jgi:hypothetical protein